MQFMSVSLISSTNKGYWIVLVTMHCIHMKCPYMQHTGYVLMQSETSARYYNIATCSDIATSSEVTLLHVAILLHVIQ